MYNMENVFKRRYFHRIVYVNLIGKNGGNSEKYIQITQENASQILVTIYQEI